MTDAEIRETIRVMLRDWNAATEEQRQAALLSARVGAERVDNQSIDRCEHCGGLLVFNQSNELWCCVNTACGDYHGDELTAADMARSGALVGRVCVMDHAHCTERSCSFYESGCIHTEEA